MLKTLIISQRGVKAVVVRIGGIETGTKVTVTV